MIHAINGTLSYQYSQHTVLESGLPDNAAWSVVLSGGGCARCAFADETEISVVSYCVFLSCFFVRSYSLGEVDAYGTFSISSFRYPETRLRPFDSRYFRVDLPPWFSSLSIVLESDVDLDARSIAKVPESALPLICLRDGSLPLPQVTNAFVKGLVLGSFSNGSSNELEDIQNEEQCYPMQKNISVKLTNEQIIRGPSYSFTANISVEGCTTSTMWGQYCNQSVDPLSCVRSDSYNLTEQFPDSKLNNKTTENGIFCRNSFDSPCHGNGEIKVFFLDVLGIAEQLIIMAMNVTFSMTQSNNTLNAGGANIVCFARHGAMPSEILHDYSGDISNGPLIVDSPKVGRWYITIIPVNLSKELGETRNAGIQVCYSLEWQVLECPMGKAGLNSILSENGSLQTVIRKETLFESYYIPVSEKVPSDSAAFPLEPLLSNSSYDEGQDNTWTYFLLDIPRGAAGGSIHIQLTSDTKIKHEIYAKSGGLPSLQSWDYYYANRTNNSVGSMFFKLYNSSEEKVDFYILYVREGTWGFGIRHVNTSKSETVMSVSLERCPKRCSSHGQCRNAFDASGLTLYSFCACDRDHGGFDCSVELVSHRGHVQQSVALIASNAAALLPAYQALRQKAFAEWVLFTASGISSGLYHACDVGTWCALSFNVLQFMDFWLSFMAVVSTFIYLTTIDEALKRTIHTVVAILTAMMAITKATRSSNIILVISIGAAGLLIGLLVELSTKFRSFSLRFGFCMNMVDRQQTIMEWLRNFMKTILRRFRWGFVLVGFAALAMAAISWKLETSQSYWIWHSIWHVSIYTSSFFFLCSKVSSLNSENQRPLDGTYELTRQDSMPRGDSEGRERPEVLTI
ncbi:transmembrane protein-like protein [Citrus sinensis]|nr:transmembrane protein-like protein [Citrus sinensis]